MSQYQVHCPSCQTSYQAAGDNAGSQIQCQNENCQAYFTVPTREQASHLSHSLFAPVQAIPYSAPQAPIVPKWYMTLSIMGPLCATLLLLGGGAVYWIINNKTVTVETPKHHVEIIPEPEPEPPTIAIEEPEPRPPKPEPEPEPEPEPDIGPEPRHFKYKANNIAYFKDNIGCIIPSSLTVSEGIAYYTTEDSYINAKDLEKNKLKWRVKLEGRCIHKIIIEEKTVYTGSAFGDFYAIDSETSRIKWAYHYTGSIVGDLSRSSRLHNQDSHPIVKNNRIYLFPQQGGIHTISRDTGKLIWKMTTSNVMTSNLLFHKDNIFFTTRFGKIYCLDDKGKELWSVTPKDKKFTFYSHQLLEIEGNAITTVYYSAVGKSPIKLAIDLRTKLQSYTVLEKSRRYGGLNNLSNGNHYKSTPSSLSYYKNKDLKWQITVKPHNYDRFNYPVRFIVDNKYGYYVNENHQIIKLNLNNGRQVSSVDASGWFIHLHGHRSKIYHKGYCGFLQYTKKGNIFYFKNITENKLIWSKDFTKMTQFYKSNNLLITLSSDGFESYDLLTGKLVWARNFNINNKTRIYSKNGKMAFIKAIGDTGFDMIGKNCELIILNEATGKSIQIYTNIKAGRWSSCYILTDTLAGVRFRDIKSTKTKFNVYSSKNKASNWSYLTSVPYRSLIIDQSSLYIADSYNITKLNQEGTLIWDKKNRLLDFIKIHGEVVVAMCQPNIFLLNVKDGAELCKINDPSKSQPVDLIIWKNLLYVSYTDRKIYIFDTLNGRLIHTSQPFESGIHKFVIMDDQIHADCYNNKLYLITEVDEKPTHEIELEPNADGKEIKIKTVTRNITNKEGRTIKVKFISATEDHIKVRLLKNGRAATIPLKKLIQKDQDFIHNWRMNRKPLPE